MTAFNVVRFRVKPGRDQDLIDAHKIPHPGFPGMRRFNLFHAGDGTYCVVGEWETMDHLAGARPAMIALLDTFRHLLDDMGGAMGVTDPVSGTSLIEMGPTKQAKVKRKAKAAAKKKPAAKPAKKKAPKKAAKRKKK